MSVQENLKTARAFYDEFNKRNFANVQKMVDDNAQFQTSSLQCKIFR